MSIIMSMEVSMESPCKVSVGHALRHAIHVYPLSPPLQGPRRVLPQGTSNRLTNSSHFARIENPISTILHG